ncbi:prolipoprotein diacylglyceryl transferase [Mobiluncus mulieris 28-1]|uniref:prolipoprotein diacylglyceryl transferase n=1 Tax=Mobiluncus mulieris TaxID=2052 RepID=UPI0001BE7A58|nr:prolipoprotein diacylglyceryl transferase [Mobiluncus mulieris]EEZ91967.1 prolipoprotein diacylglyceryl transferase [Mobiluncus mulieris 28-1]
MSFTLISVFSALMEPGLAWPVSIPSPPSPVFLSLGSLTVRWYAVWILTGMVVAIIWSAKRWESRGGNPDLLWDVGVYVCVFGILGARAMAVASYPHQYFGPGIPWWQPFAIWQGGLAIYGGLIAGLLTMIVMLRRRRLPVGVFIDAVAPTVLVAQSLGRLGNYFNQEVYGSATTLPWGLRIADANLPSGVASGTLFHPTFLYEILWNLIGVGVILGYEHYRKQAGKLYAWELAALYFLFYSVGRFALEFVRIDFQYTVLGIRWFQIVAGAGVLFGLILLNVARRWRQPSQLPRLAPHEAETKSETKVSEITKPENR